MNPTRQNRPSRGRSGRSTTNLRRANSNSPKRLAKSRGGRPLRRKFPSTEGGGRNRQNSRRGGGRKMLTFDPSRFINKNPVAVVEDVYEPKNSFQTLNLNERLVKTIIGMGIVKPTPIQDQIIPEILKGRDVIGLAETGTGKTAAFLIPLIEQTIQNKNKQTLILAPTRELAIQIKEELRRLSSSFKMFSVICVGGMNIGPQIRALRYTNQFIIGTPGRVIDLMDRKYIKPERITTVVLDEADRMLDMGFIHDMKKIVSQIPKTRGTLFFSATMSKAVEPLINDFLNNPITVSVKKKDVTDSIEQDVIHHNDENKFSKLLELLGNDESKKVIIFGSMKHRVEKLSQQLTEKSIPAESIHGNKGHSQRQRALTKFKSGHTQVLVATDVAARGIHVDDVTHVINYDLPQTFEDYVHRIGRTGRGDKRGKALTFVLTK